MTGGGGFVGSYVLARMLGAGLTVTLVGPDLGVSPYTAAVVAARSVRFVSCDLAFEDQDVLRAAVDDADALVLLDDANGPAPVTRVLRAAGDRFRHVVFASSSSVYGSPARLPVRESDALSPVTPSGTAKLACEQTVTAFAASGGTATIVRCSSVYGPGERDSNAIPDLIRRALAGEMPSIPGDALDEDDYVHVSDVADATLAAVRRRVDGVYNIGTGIATSTLDLAQLVFGLAGQPATPVFDAPRDPARARIRMVCDTELASAQLGFKARRSLREGILEEIGWFRSRLSPSRSSARARRWMRAVRVGVETTAHASPVGAGPAAL
jgi:UDP-glucose 4-epimerase